jgi:hypothetical protein
MPSNLRGRTPHGLDWLKAWPERPCAGTIYNRYGTWNKALIAQGYHPTAMESHLARVPSAGF